jgi:opine dehydrogenase
MLSTVADHSQSTLFDTEQTSGGGWLRARLSGGWAGANAPSLPPARQLPTPPRAPETRKLSVAVLGAGHGGLALAGYLAEHRHRVALWNRSPERIAPVAALGDIHLTPPGSATVHTSVAVATCNMAAALAQSRLVLVAVPAYAHADVARACAPHLRNGQTVLLLPGRTGGALEFRRVLRQAGCRARLLLGEANTFPFAARSLGPAAAVIYGAKADVQAAALPATLTPQLLAECRLALPMLSAARSVLHTGLANFGAILHPVITLLNAERIARGESFDFYAEGVTSEVASILATADAERLRVARAYGVAVPSLTSWIGASYGHHADTIEAAVGGNPAYIGIKAPSTLAHRYLLEEVPTGLIPLVELGRAAGLALPTLTSLVRQARAVLAGTPWPRQRTLDILGLEGLGTRAIRRFVERGVTVAPRYFAAARAAPFGRLSAGRRVVPSVDLIGSMIA